MNALRRRTLLAAGSLLWSGGALSRLAEAKDGQKRPKMLPPLPLSMAVAVDDEGAPVVDACFVATQVREAQRLLKPHGVLVRWTERRTLPKGHARLEDAEDRDDLAVYHREKVINVMIVDRLRDKDDPKRFRMGVRWRLRRDLRKDYVILAASAVPTVLTHELGHFFGHGHSPVVDIVMSYERENPDRVAFDARQGAKMRATVRRYLKTGKVVATEADDRAATTCTG